MKDAVTVRDDPPTQAGQGDRIAKLEMALSVQRVAIDKYGGRILELDDHLNLARFRIEQLENKFEKMTALVDRWED